MKEEKKDKFEICEIYSKIIRNKKIRDNYRIFQVWEIFGNQLCIIFQGVRLFWYIEVTVCCIGGCRVRFRIRSLIYIVFIREKVYKDYLKIFRQKELVSFSRYKFGGKGIEIKRFYYGKVYKILFREMVRIYRSSKRQIFL